MGSLVLEGAIREADRALADDVLNFFSHPRPEHDVTGPLLAHLDAQGLHVCVTACLDEGFWGTIIFSPLKIIHAGMKAHHGGSRNSDTLKGHFLFSSGQPFCMTPFSI